MGNSGTCLKLRELYIVLLPDNQRHFDFLPGSVLYIVYKNDNRLTFPDMKEGQIRYTRLHVFNRLDNNGL